MKLQIVLLCLCCYANASNILGFFPVPFKSYYTFVKPLIGELAKRGHNVTVYTVFASEKPPKEYYEIDIQLCLPALRGGRIDQIVSAVSVFTILRYYRYLISDVKNIVECAPLVRLVNSTDNFDVLLTNLAHYEWYIGFAYKFSTPIVNIFPNTLCTWFADAVGAVTNPSYVPNFFGDFSHRMSFEERVYNLYVYVTLKLLGGYYVFDSSQNLANEIFGNNVPSLREIVKNCSVTLSNTYPPYQPPLPVPPNVVQVGGMHIGDVKLLPENIEKFINESEHGVVYFCMGSLLRGETFPEEKRNAFLYAFSKIPQRVLWKWEGDVLPGKSDNIMISKWMPQRDILAHPNVKLFISHGGLLGTSEAVYEGVPVLGIPIFGDQRTNIKSLEANGAGELLDYNEISKEVVLEKIQRLLNDPKYKENAKQLSARYRDRPMSPLDTAVYWTEYVIRHKGAPHLRTAAADMPWYQYLLLDVIAFLIVIFVSALAIIYYSVKLTFRFLCNLICGKKSSSKPVKKVKRN